MALGNRRVRNTAGIYGRSDVGQLPSAAMDPYVALFGQAPAQVSGVAPAGSHPLYDTEHNRRLLDRESAITSAFKAIEPALREVAAIQYQEGFEERAQDIMSARLGFALPADLLRANWVSPLNMRKLYVYSVFQIFRQLANRDFDRNAANLSEGKPVERLIQKWGFHAIDITPCADGRLSGVVDYILRVPPSVVANRKSFAGSMFDVEESVRNWSDIELRRHREGVPNASSEPTRYLKIGVYHTSSSDPEHEGCAAHGSDERVAATALMDRLKDFSNAIENSFCCGAQVATLLIGVDTDTDAIKLHVPDAQGELSLERYIDNAQLFDVTKGMAREEAKESIRAAVAEAAGASIDDSPTEGMRWFCGYLLKNNMAQIDYVRTYHEGRYKDLGHTERFITVGDSFDDVQMRNLAYQAQMETIEEGAADMDVGIKIFRKVNMANELPIPAFIHFRYDGRVPGSRERAIVRCKRLNQAMHARYPDLVREGWLYTYATVKDRQPGRQLEEIDTRDSLAERGCGCGCKKSESN